MKKNGFTLIELIATFGLLSMLATILINLFIGKINETKQNARNTLIESIELAAENYILDNTDELTEFNKKDFIYLKLQTLVEKEYFKESLIDPTTKKSLPLSDEVYVVRENNGKIIAKYDIDQRNKTKLVLNGSYNQYLEQGQEYIDLGINAVSVEGNDVSKDVIAEGSVDSDAIGIYKIKYKYDNVYLVRNVIVYKGKPSLPENTTAVQYITNLYENESTLKNGLVKTSVTFDEKIYDAGIRYTGSNPNNKVYYNCEEKDENNVKYGMKTYDYKNSCEIWRIIGVFDTQTSINGKTEKRVKIINTESTFAASWDSSKGRIGINQWGPTTYIDGNLYEGADLMRLLNGYYIGKSGSLCLYCNNYGQETCEQICDTSDNTLKNQKMKPLTSLAKNQIESVLWYTYGSRYPHSEKFTFSNTSYVYLEEKGIEVKLVGCQDSTIPECEIDGVIRNNEWIGLVGLKSISDMGYADGWLYTGWSITPFAALDTQQIWRGNNSNAEPKSSYLSSIVQPSVYLKPEIIIKEGNGNTYPYKLGK